MATIAVIGGAGYVGLTYAASLVELGHDVVGLDVDAGKIQRLAHGSAPIHEPGLDALLARGLAGGRLRFTTDYAEAVPAADFAFICVGTPPDGDGRADMQYVVAAARAIGEHGRGHTVVVNKSTMPIGSARFVADILIEHAPAGATFAVVSNPEFLREGSAIEDVFHPDRIVLGADDPAAAEAVAGLFAPLGAPVLITEPHSAEMIKYASNAFLATKISFINEIAAICERVGADVTTVAEGMGLDQRIGPRFRRAGMGFGGSCFPKDVRALAAMAREHGYAPALLASVLAVNAAMRDEVIEKLRAHLGGLANRTVGILGLAFKPDTDDTREAPAVALMHALLAAGARVQATDPVAVPHVVGHFPDVRFSSDAYGAAMGADAVVLATEWATYRALNLDRLANAMRGRLVVDGRNALDPRAVAAAGLTYRGVGRAQPAAIAVMRAACGEAPAAERSPASIVIVPNERQVPIV